MEPFHLREERGEGYFDQFLNYHRNRQPTPDAFLRALDEKDEAHSKPLSEHVVRSHKRRYAQLQTTAAQREDVDVVREWKSLLPLFSHGAEPLSVASEMRALAQRLEPHRPRSRKQRRVDAAAEQPPRKRRKKRLWEEASPTSDEASGKGTGDEAASISERELLGLRRRFELFSEKATLLMTNGDHNTYQQTRDSLIDRIRMAETGQGQAKSKAEEKQWMYRWKHDAMAQSYGPFSCREMTQWNVCTKMCF